MQTPPDDAEAHEADGLRERKKRATRRALQRAALALAAAEGPDTTVERICEEAEVSTRTFFNYFSTKEEAIVGPPPEAPPDDLLAAFEAGGPTGDLLVDLGTTVVDHLRTSIPTARELSLRHDVLRDHPELLAHHLHGFAEIEHRWNHAAARRLGGSPYDAHSQLVGALAVALMRLTVRRWIRAEGTEIEAHGDDLLRALADLR